MSLQTGTFDRDLIAILPRLQAYALSLTRSRDNANDLVQQTTLKALAGRDTFQIGTNFAGWIFRIQRNEFLAELRRANGNVDVYDEVMHTATDLPRQEAGLAMGEFLTAFQKLDRATRTVLLLSQIEGLSYAQISDRTGVSTGTLKSRVSRGRLTLAHLVERGNLRRSKRGEDEKTKARRRTPRKSAAEEVARRRVAGS